MGVIAEAKKECAAKCKYIGICCNSKELGKLQNKDPLTLTGDEHEMLENLADQLYELCMSPSPEICGLYQGYEKGK